MDEVGDALDYQKNVHPERQSGLGHIKSATVDIGFIKKVIPIIDFEKVQRNDSISDLRSEGSNNHNQQDVDKVKSYIKKGLKIKEL